MKCPVDGEALVMSERSGVEIDYCPSCRGVWLDRGELDKILARDDARGGRGDRSGRDERDRIEERGDGDGRQGRRRRRDSFLSEIFDFG